MPRSIRPKLSFANAMVILLTFIVLGGGAYAAIKLPKNSVGTRQLKKGAVTKAKISPATLKQLRGASGPSGPPGAAAPAGGVLPAGVTLRGVAATGSGGTDTENRFSDSPVSFGGYVLSFRPVVHVIGLDQPAPPQCPGTVSSPQANPGQLCIFLARSSPNGIGTILVRDPTVTSGAGNGVKFDLTTSTTEQVGDGRVSPVGFALAMTVTATNAVSIEGTWAVTG